MYTTTKDYEGIRYRARAAFKSQMSTFVLALLLIWALASVASSIIEAIFPHTTGTFGPEFAGSTAVWAALLAFVVELVLQVMVVGYNRMQLRALRGEKVEVSGIFDFYRTDFERMVVFYLLMIVRIFLWSLLLIVPGIIAAYRYAQAPLLIFEHPELTPTQALERSSQMMEGHKFELFVLQLTFIGWFLLGCITFGIGLLWVVPYYQLAQSEFYLRLTGESAVSPTDGAPVSYVATAVGAPASTGESAPTAVVTAASEHPAIDIDISTAEGTVYQIDRDNIRVTFDGPGSVVITTKASEAEEVTLDVNTATGTVEKTGPDQVTVTFATAGEVLISNVTDDGATPAAE